MRTIEVVLLVALGIMLGWLLLGIPLAHATQLFADYNTNTIKQTNPRQGNAMSTLEQIAQKHGLTLDQAQQLKSAICNTWDYIGYDYMDCCGGETEALNIFDSYAEMVAEATVDADRLRSHNPGMDWFYDLKGDILKIAEEVWEARA